MKVKALEKAIEKLNEKIDEYNTKVSIMRTAEDKAYYESLILALEAGRAKLVREVEQHTKGEYRF